MTEVLYPPTSEPDPGDYSHRIAVDVGGGSDDEPFIVLQAGEHPPAGVQAIENTWALVVLRGQPVAFLSPDIVTSLDPYLPVAAVFDEQDEAYVADFRDPRGYFERNLGRPREVFGRVIVFSRDYADPPEIFGRPAYGAPVRAVLTEFARARCARGQILPPGVLCDPACRCERRR